jgi:hypothetical protein
VFLHPLGLLALAGVPAVALLHLYRRRYRPRTVSAVFLWSAEDHTPAAGRKREPLRRSKSFWCEVLAALCLGLAFASPRPFGTSEASHLVLVLDRSASMGAGGAHATRDLALAAVHERIDRLARGSRVTLIGSGVRPVVLAGPAALPLEARERLTTFMPGLAHHELGPALALAFELSGGRAVTLVTDRFDETSAPPEVELVAVGRSAPNVGIVAASRRRTAEQPATGGGATNSVERVSLTVASFASDAALRTLRLETLEGAPLAGRDLALAPGTESHVSFELPEDTPLVVARLVQPAAPSNDRDDRDGLAADDVAWLARAPRRTVRLASTLPSELAATLGVDSAADPSNIDRWLALVPDAVDTINPSAAHLVLATGLIGGDAWVLALAAPGPDKGHFIGPFLTDPAHPLLGGLTLEGIVWCADTGAELQGAPFVSAGELALASEVHEGARIAWLLNLDPTRSSLQRSPDWPILLTNAAETRRAALPGPAATSLALGEPFRFRVDAPTTLRWRHEASATGPVDSEAKTFRADSTLVIDDIELPGVYELAELAPSGAATPVARIGVSLSDRAESDLAQRSTGTRAAVADEATLRAGFSWVEVALLSLALVCLALDWWVLRRPIETHARDTREALA